MIGELLILYCKLLCNSIKKIAWKAALGVPPQWFNRNRALALGIVASGSAIGGLVLPFVITRINSSLNVEWWVCLHNHPRYLRITNSKCVKKGLIECWASLSLLQTSSHAFLSRKSSRDTRRARNLCRCVKYSTLPCSKIQTILCGSLALASHSWVSSFHFSSCQVRLGDIIWLAITVIYLFYYLLFLQPTSLTLACLHPTLLQLLLCCQQPTSSVALSLGKQMCLVTPVTVVLTKHPDRYVGDRIGRLNADILFKLLCGISSLTIWIYARTYVSIMGYAVIFGFLCSSYIALSKYNSPYLYKFEIGIAQYVLFTVSPITATILGMKRFPTGLTVLLLTNMVSVLGPNIASAVETSLNAEPYLVYKVFAGVTYLLGGLILAALKIKMTKSLFAKI